MSRPGHQVSNRRLPPFPGHSSQIVWTKKSGTNLQNWQWDADGPIPMDMMGLLLAKYPQVVETYVHESVSVETLQEWLKQKKAPDGHKLDSDMKTRYTETNIKKVQQSLKKDICQDDNLNPLLSELAGIVSRAIKANSSTLYVVGTAGKEICLFRPQSTRGLRTCENLKKGTTVAAHVGVTRQAVLVKDILTDDRFPLGIGVEGSSAHSVICIPVIAGKDLIVVLEFTRTWEAGAFSGDEFQIALSLSSWAGTAIEQTLLNQTLAKQAEFNDFLLEVSKVLFDEVKTTETVIEKIMSFAKTLVDADRCALFLVNPSRTELCAELFDEGKEVDGKPLFTQKQDIRFSIDCGIAGHVARTGEVVNILDAYTDPRFNREIDKKTGYTTRNLLCMPVINKGEVIGVVQMVNKKSGPTFTKFDELSFKTFAVYCALALHISKVYRELSHKNNLYEVTREMARYYTTCTSKDAAELMASPYPKSIPRHFHTFDFHWMDCEPSLPQMFIWMIHDLFGDSCFSLPQLCRFILTVKRGYREVPYHNWRHGFCVAHDMYIIMKFLCGKAFSSKEAMALVIGAVCHDLDHRGYSNSFLQKCEQPLAALYSTSVMEQHHFQCAVAILQDEDHNIFSQMSSEEYRQMLDMIRHAIISTDLVLYFENKKNVENWIQEGVIDIEHNAEHRDAVKGMLMTGADLAASVKPWDFHRMTADLIYEEFFSQGDEEKRSGFDPIPMMDRRCKADIPKQQIGFLQFVCLPGYQALSTLFPELEILCDAVRVNMGNWQLVSEGREPQMWCPTESWQAVD